jgi:hypothetical protein
MNYDHKYDDIINMPNHRSKKHPHMSLYARSGQFSPFAALTGYEDAVRETGREVLERIEIDEERKLIIDGKLQLIRENIYKKQEVTFTFFVPDSRKNGGIYITKEGIVKKFDELGQRIILADKSEIPIEELIDVSMEN